MAEACECGRVTGPRLVPGDGQCPVCWTARYVLTAGRPPAEPPLVTAAGPGRWAVRPAPPVDVAPRSPVCLLTLAVGPKGDELERASGPALRRYAGRCGYDYHVMRVPASPWACGEKWRARAYLEHYERLVWFDADAIPAPDAEPLTELVPEDAIGIFDERHLHAAAGGIGTGAGWIDREYQDLARSQGWPDPPPAVVWNSGVYVLSRRHAGFLDPPLRPIPAVWCAEQWTETFRAHQYRYRVIDLGRAWNWVYWPHRKEPGFTLERPLPGVKVYHWAGLADHAERVRQMRAMRAALYPGLADDGDPGRPADCRHFAELGGRDRQRLGLDHARRWGRCGLNLTLPGGRPGIVCPCQGCGPACPGYAADG